MKPITVLLLPVFLASGFVCPAQVAPPFKLNDYKYRFQRVRGLGFDGRLFHDNDNEVLQKKTRNNSLRLEGTYFYTLSSNRWQCYTRAHVAANVSHRSETFQIPAPLPKESQTILQPRLELNH